MSDPERGAYSPQNDALLAFDARQSRSGGGGFPTTLAISLVILVVLIVAIVLFYRSGVRSSGPGPAPVGTPVAQIKAPAPATGPSSDASAGLQIYKTDGVPAPTPAAPTFAPPPEQPKPRPTVAVTAGPPLAEAGATSAKTVQGSSKDEIEALIEESEKPAKPKQAKPMVAAVAVAPSAKPAAASAVVVGASAQIGAYSSEALAAKGWSDTAAAFGGDMSGKGKHFEPVSKDGKTLYRAAVTGFGSKTEAQAFCVKLKAAGHACLVK